MRCLFLILVTALSCLAAPKDSAVKVSTVRFVEDEKHVTQIKGCFGSGTVIEYKDGWSYVLTCRHVCPDANRVVFVIVGDRCIQARFVGADGTADLALIKVSEQLPVTPVADRPPDSGTEAQQFGFPGAGPQEPKHGAIVGTLDQDGRGYVPNYVQLIVHPGDSGSGVFVGDKLVGVVYAGTKNGEQFTAPSMVVKLADVRRFLKDPTASPPKAEPQKEAPAPAPAYCPPGKP